MARVSLEDLRATAAGIDRAKIDATTEEDIRRHAIEDGEDPDAVPTGYRLLQPVTAIRAKLGMTQSAFAGALGVPVATLRNWEQGRKPPDPAAAALLRVVDREPEAVFRALGVALPKLGRTTMPRRPTAREGSAGGSGARSPKPRG
ncbi:helix-turn-helix domain-containing protein [Methylobacterium sp. Gmos1]